MPSCCYSNNNFNCLWCQQSQQTVLQMWEEPRKERGERTEWHRKEQSGEVRGEVGRYSRSWRVSSLPAAHHSVAQSDRHTDKREWRQTLAVSVRASPSSSPPPSSNCQSSPLVLGLLSLSLYRNHTHLVVTLSRLNTSFHSHNPQVLLKHTLSFTSARV